jgi:chemosensory pili system protein ChpC
MSKDDTTDIEIRGVLLPLHEAQLLLPNASVSEVVGLEELRVEADMPRWFLGVQMWRGQEIPIISFEALIEIPVIEPGVRSRVAVCNTLGGNPKRPFIGLLLTSTPRLVTVTEDVVSPQTNEQELGDAVMRQVTINGESAWIPDMNSVEWVVQEAMS